MDRDKVLKLAKLARIDISEEEAEGLSADMGSILGYVKDIKEASVSSSNLSQDDFPLRNVVREDVGAHESGMHTENILSQAPLRDRDYLKVKKILQ